MSTLDQIEVDIEQLSLDEQLHLIEFLARAIRRRMTSDPDADLATMAADPDIQRELVAINAEFANSHLTQRARASGSHLTNDTAQDK